MFFLLLLNYIFGSFLDVSKFWSKILSFQRHGVGWFKDQYRKFSLFFFVMKNTLIWQFLSKSNNGWILMKSPRQMSEFILEMFLFQKIFVNSFFHICETKLIFISLNVYISYQQKSLENLNHQFLFVKQDPELPKISES